MSAYLIDWLHLSLRFLHIIAGIAWIGASFYFNALENKLNRKPPQRQGIAGTLWAVHGGGFYFLEKYTTYPDDLPSPLHWFKWEAYVTWLSGMALLAVVYYLNASSYLIATDNGMSPLVACILSISGIFITWVIYDLLCRSKIASNHNVMIAIIITIFTFAAYFYHHFFTSRALFIQIGAMIGTIMVANVFFVIIPIQKKLIQACTNKTPVSKRLGYKGYIRSRHNNYFTLPVVFLMISGHFPFIYEVENNWVVLSLVCILAMVIRHVFNLHSENKPVKGYVSVIILLLAGLIFGLKPPTLQVENNQYVHFGVIKKIIHQRCVTCHSSSPIDQLFKTAPAGFKLDTQAQIEASVDAIYARTIATQSMPFNNITKMTDAERALLAQWILQFKTNE